MSRSLERRRRVTGMLRGMLTIVAAFLAGVILWVAVYILNFYLTN